jgi:hypothetical protein
LKNSEDCKALSHKKTKTKTKKKKRIGAMMVFLWSQEFGKLLLCREDCKALSHKKKTKKKIDGGFAGILYVNVLQIH